MKTKPETTLSGPRLRCRDKWENGFYGTYKGHRVAIERDHKTEPWAFLVTAPSGLNVADGYTKEPMTLREAIIHALKAAGLWRNDELSPQRNCQP